MKLNSPKDVVTPQHSTPAGGLTIGHVAHELNSLLDGTMRCLSMAQRTIDEANSAASFNSVNVADRLRLAQHGMQRMATLLERAMKTSCAEVALFSENQTLNALTSQIIQTLQPLANEHDVEFEVHISPKAATAPAATLGPVLLNGLRNAIQACAAAESGPRCVELSIMINCAGQLHVVIADTGAGLPDDLGFESRLPADGHGFGLDLSRRIVHDLGGELRLMSVPFGPGAILEATIPLLRLAEVGKAAHHD